MLVETDDMVGVGEIAELAGVSTAAVSNWQRRAPVPFPKPIKVLKTGSIWLLPDIITFLAARENDHRARVAEKLRRKREEANALEKQLEMLDSVDA